MPQLEKEIVIQNENGLHARPAAIFVQIASKYNSSVTIEKDGGRVNGASIMGLLTLGAMQGATIKLIIDGEDAEELLEELVTFLMKEDIDG